MEIASTFSARFVLGEAVPHGSGRDIYRAYDAQRGNAEVSAIRSATGDAPRWRRACAVDLAGIAKAELEPHLLRIFETELRPDGRWSITEPLGGARTLGELIARYPAGAARSLSIDDAYDAFEQLSRGVLALHRAGVIHGALSPSCMWRMPDGSWKVEWLAGAASLGALPRESGERAAPEALAGTHTFAGDVYALAMSMYELFVGAEVFASAFVGFDAAAPDAWPRAHLEARRHLPPATFANERMDASVSELLVRMLTPDAERRPVMLEVLGTLEARGARAATGGPQASTTYTQAPAAADGTSKSREGWLGLALVALFALQLASIGALALAANSMRARTLAHVDSELDALERDVRAAVAPISDLTRDRTAEELSKQVARIERDLERHTSEQGSFALRLEQLASSSPSRELDSARTGMDTLRQQLELLRGEAGRVQSIVRTVPQSPSEAVVMGTTTQHASGFLKTTSAAGADLVVLTTALNSGAGFAQLNNASGEKRVVLTVDSGDSGALEIHNTRGNRVVSVSSGSRLHGGRISIHAEDGEERATLELDSGGNGNVFVNDASGGFVSLRNGRDVAEAMRCRPGHKPAPGDVVAIVGSDRDEPLVGVTTTPGSPLALGVVSGHGALVPSLVMGNTGSDDEAPIAMAGQVEVHVNTTGGAIAVGDLLTTSAVAGQAMRADPLRVPAGAVVGKALQELTQGEGYVRMLVWTR